MGDSKKTGLEFERVSRRKAVKTIVGGVSALAAYNMLPVKWEKPIIEQIFLPVHAATSGLSLSDPCNITVIKGTQDSSSVTIKVTGFVIPPAAGVPVSIQAYGTPSSSKESAKTITNKEGRFEATLVLTTTSGIGTVHVTTTAEGASGAAKCSVDVSQASASADDTPADRYPISSSPSSLSRTNTEGDSGDDIYIVFDGATSLTLVAVADLGPHPPSADAVIGIDTDWNQASVWEHYDNGSNWTVAGTNVGGGYQPSGSYYVIISGSGPGTTFRVDFDVTVDANLPPTATVSNVTVQPWT